jgi:hypothetical protein
MLFQPIGKCTAKIFVILEAVQLLGTKPHTCVETRRLPLPAHSVDGQAPQRLFPWHDIRFRNRLLG